MRILYPFAVSKPGGAEYATKALMSSLADRGHDLVYTAPIGSDVDHLFADVARRVDAPDLGLPPRGRVRRLWWAWRVGQCGAQFLVDADVDVVHTNSGDMHCAWAIASARNRIPHVWHQHNVYVPRGILGRPRLVADRIAWPTARVIAVSEYIRKSIPRNMQSRTIVIRNPVLPLQESHQRFPRSKTVLAFVGRFVESKRPEIVLDVLAQLQASGGGRKRFSAVIIGAGEFEQEVALHNRARELGVEASVRFLPWQDDPYSAIAEDGILVCPFEREAYSRVIVEAMMTGIPVVAANCGGNREIVQHELTGLLATPRDVDDFAAKVQWLLRNPEQTAAMVREARTWALENHRLDNHVDAVLHVYGSASRPGPRGWLAGA